MNKLLFRIVMCLSLGVGVFASTTSRAQCTNCRKFEQPISLKHAFDFDNDFGVTTHELFANSEGSIEVRMYAKDLYTTGGRGDTDAFLYGVLVYGDADGDTNETWTVAAPASECLSGTCPSRSSTDYKPRFLRVWRALSGPLNSLKEHSIMEVIIEVEFSGDAGVDDIHEINLPGVRRLGDEDVIDDEKIRGVDFEIKALDETPDIVIPHTTYHDLKLAIASPGSFVKVMPGQESVFVVAQSLSEVELHCSLCDSDEATVDEYDTDVYTLGSESFSLYKITKPESKPLLITSGGGGPYVTAYNLEIQTFLQTTVNEKSLNRANHTSDILIAAHRGSWQEAAIAENTITAYNNAIALGADLMEIDIVKTADGQFIICHDSFVDRLIQFTGETNMKKYAEIPIKRFNWNTDIVDAKSGLSLPALKNGALKDRFGNVLSPAQHLLTIEQLMDYVKVAKSKQVVMSLDHAFDFVKELTAMFMKEDIEDNFLWKGSGKTPATELLSTHTLIMQQIAYTPVYQEWMFKDIGSDPELQAKGYDVLTDWDNYKDYVTLHDWTIPGCEVTFKKAITTTTPGMYGPIPFKGVATEERRADPGVTKKQHDDALAFVVANKDQFWIGLSPWFPLFGNDPWSPEKSSNTGNFAPAYDWRADMSFCIDYCKVNYFITDHPRYTVNYWNARPH